jgi:hypothetical protein
MRIWIVEGVGLNNRNYRYKFIIKSECLFFHNPQECEYYINESLDQDELLPEIGSSHEEELKEGEQFYNPIIQ